jgi:hypothetical protein
MDWFVANPLLTLSMAFGFVTGGAVHTIAGLSSYLVVKLLRILFATPTGRRYAKDSGTPA